MTKEQIFLQLKADLEARGLTTSTIRKYTSAVRAFQDYFKLPADKMCEQEIMTFQRHLLVEKKLQPISVNDYNTAFRFLYAVTLKSPLNYLLVPKLKVNRRIPSSSRNGSTVNASVHVRMLRRKYSGISKSIIKLSPA